MKYLFIVLMFVTNINYCFSYDFKIKDKYEATVFGTSDDNKAHVKSAPFRLGEITLEKAKQVPEVFWYNKTLKYAKAIQEKEAPLAFMIAGTGGNHISPKVKLMASILYNLGYSVVTLPSPSHSNFIVAASSNSSVGEIETDMQDLKEVILQIYKDLQKEENIKVSSFVVGGYSLGATHSAFLSYYADKDDDYPIKFSKVLMVNPPYDILESAIKIDKLYKKTVGERPEDFVKFYDKIYANVASTYNALGGIAIGPEIFFEMYKQKNLSRKDIEAAIGSAFRLSSTDMVFSIDVMRKMGVVVPKDVTLGQYDILRTYYIKSFAYGFEAYANQILTAIYNKPLIELSYNTSLPAIENYLKESDKIYVMHNKNDFILKDGDIDYLKKIFNSRAKIYPYGGHCGNMDHKENVAHIEKLFKLSEGEY